MTYFWFIGVILIVHVCINNAFGWTWSNAVLIFCLAISLFAEFVRLWARALK